MFSSTSYGYTSVETPRHPLTCIYRLPALRPAPLIGLPGSVLSEPPSSSNTSASHSTDFRPTCPPTKSQSRPSHPDRYIAMLCFSFSPVLVLSNSWSQNVVKSLLAPFSSTSNLFLAAPHPHLQASPSGRPHDRGSLWELALVAVGNPGKGEGCEARGRWGGSHSPPTD
ncbi:hypothetical protein LX32DRAFT_135851 [Colletotrichum zoysiae]|uniref:Uncharacterized protein n=1 Tax=Colletotrichum zoysiae TaxID=1216348 RepID=A0AAD9LWS2_9PEZI|nr:hypothetical protein LX32DRAFT_135851 [Colletotrichum zoysiae]